MGDFNRDLLQANTKKTWLEYMESFALNKLLSLQLELQIIQKHLLTIYIVIV